MGSLTMQTRHYSHQIPHGRAISFRAPNNSLPDLVGFAAPSADLDSFSPASPLDSSTPEPLPVRHACAPDRRAVSALSSCPIRPNKCSCEGRHQSKTEPAAVITTTTVTTDTTKPNKWNATACSRVGQWTATSKHSEVTCGDRLVQRKCCRDDKSLPAMRPAVRSATTRTACP